jgi:hypothetical protein
MTLVSTPNLPSPSVSVGAVTVSAQLLTNASTLFPASISASAQIAAHTLVATPNFPAVSLLAQARIEANQLLVSVLLPNAVILGGALLIPPVDLIGSDHLQGTLIGSDHGQSSLRGKDDSVTYL